jgi:hypothetical protein
MKMRLRSLLVLGMVLSLLFALALLLQPAIILKFFGLGGTPSEGVLAQLIGAGLIGFGLLCWLAKDFVDPQAVQGAVLPLFVATAVAFVVALLAVLAKIPKGGNTWIVVILFLAFAAGFAYFQFFGPRE